MKVRSMFLSLHRPRITSTPHSTISIVSPTLVHMKNLESNEFNHPTDLIPTLFQHHSGRDPQQEFKVDRDDARFQKAKRVGRY